MTVFRVLFIVTGVTAMLAWLIQWMVLGVLFPQWADGHGLLIDHDPSRFNAVALAQAAAIAEEGWSAWELRPNNWGVSGILSAWYALTLPSPAAFVPIQALLYGIAAACLYVIFRAITGQGQWALCGLLPLFFPTSAMIYAQPHRDIFVFAGFSLVVLAWIQWLRWVTEPADRPFIAGLGALIALLAGFTAVWVVRPYAAEILLAVNALMLGLLLLMVVTRAVRRRQVEPPAIAVTVTALAAVVMTTQLPGDAHYDQIYVTDRGVSPSAVQEPAGKEGSPGDIKVRQPDPDSMVSESAALSQQWVETAALPARIDDQFRRLSTARDSFAMENHFARSAIDLDRRFASVGDIIEYTPRALSIGLLAPFPGDWLPQSEAPTQRNLERIVAGGEMVVVYLLLPFFLLALYQWGRQPELWFALIPAGAWLMAYSYTVPVVGALVRYRFPAYVILLGLAIVMATVCCRRWIGRSQPLTA